MKIRQDFKKMKQGGHLCSFCKDTTEQLSVVLPFLFAGLEKNEKCICILTEPSKTALVKALMNLGLDTAKCDGWGQFGFPKPEESYLKNGKFDPEMMIKKFEEIERQAVHSGFSGVRVAGEARIFNSGFPGNERLFEYEVKVNNLFRKSRTTALCLYEEDSIKEDILRNALYTHPQVVIHGVLRENRFYLPPEELLAGNNKYSGLSYSRMKEELQAK
jgi:hypothetical protein